MAAIPSLSAAMFALCAQYQAPNSHEACVKALDAGTRQSGIRQTYDTAENELNRVVERTAENKLGKDAVSAIIAGAFVYKAVDQKSLTFGLTHSLSNTITPNSYSLNMKWNW